MLKSMSNIEFLGFLKDYIELHTLKNGADNENNIFLRNTLEKLNHMPTKFYLSQNDYDLDVLQNTIMTWLEQGDNARNDKQLDYIRNRVFPAYRHFLTTIGSWMGVAID